VANQKNIVVEGKEVYNAKRLSWQQASCTRCQGMPAGRRARICRGNRVVSHARRREGMLAATRKTVTQRRVCVVQRRPLPSTRARAVSRAVTSARRRKRVFARPASMQARTLSASSPRGAIWRRSWETCLLHAAPPSPPASSPCLITLAYLCCFFSARHEWHASAENILCAR